MLTPARFARSWREDLETAQPITFADPAEARRTPHSGSTSAPEDLIGADRADERPRAVAVVPLRSLSGLAARDDTATYDATPTNPRLSLRVDR